jgi:hypothetical protein
MICFFHPLEDDMISYWRYARGRNRRSGWRGSCVSMWEGAREKDSLRGSLLERDSERQREKV